VRLLSEHDIPWLHDICRRRYAPGFSHETAEGWFVNIVLKSPMIFHAARTDDAFIITLLSCVPWYPADFEANVIFLCAEEGKTWEVIKLLRSSVQWARDRNCCMWKISGDTVYDMAPLAKRVGAMELAPRYLLRL